MTRIFSFFICLASVTAAWAWGGHNIKATECMEQGRYRESADFWQRHVAEIEDSIAHGIDPESVFRDMLLSLSKQANCLYMIDDQTGMEAISKKYEKIAVEFAEILDDDMTEEVLAHMSKNNASILYYYTDIYDEAFKECEDWYIECFEHIDPYDSDFMSTTSLDMAQLYYKWGQKTNSTTEYKKALDALRSSGVNTPVVQSQIAITKARLGSVAEADSEARTYFTEAIAEIDKAIKAEKDEDAKTEMQRKKGKILMLQADRLKIDNYKKARKCYEQYLDRQKKRIAVEYSQMSESQRRQAWLALHQFVYDCCRLGPQAADMAYDLALYSKGYLMRPAHEKMATWRNIAAKLDANEAAVEFYTFDGRLKAVIVEKGSKLPKMIDIGDISKILGHELFFGLTLGAALESTESNVKNYIYNDTELPAMIWTPDLMYALRDKSKIYFSPDGFLHQLAIEYMLPKEDVTAYRLSTTARLLKPRKRLDGNTLLCGGVDYDKADSDGTTTDNDLAAYRYLEGRIGTLNYLPGSKKEVDSIYTMRDHQGDCLIEGSKASESRIRTLTPGYQIAHLSTHGYFASKFPTANDLKSPVDDNALSHSGLMFAGATNNLNSALFDPSTADGILSAAEIGSSDWSNVDLVVLSACQTGLGYQTDDGIYGMQRGLKMGGVDGMIVSLWSVDDNATYILMKLFYEELSKNPDSAHTAFMNARRRLMTEITHSESRFSPAKLSQTPVYGDEGTDRGDGASETKKGVYAAPVFSNPFITIDLF